MARRVIGSVLQLFAQVNKAAPNRSKESDGTFPSPQHSIDNPNSDHEPHLVPGVGAEICTAGDYTHDPGDGADMDVLAEQLRLSRDPRIKYVIRRDRMFSSYATSKVPAWTWRDYTGNYHGTHMHLSVVDRPIADTWTPWRITMALDLDQDGDFTALKHRIDAIIDMDLVNPKGDDLKPEPNRLAEALIAIGGKLDQILTILKATPDPEDPGAQQVKAALQAWMAAAVAANTDPDDVSP